MYASDQKLWNPHKMSLKNSQGRSSKARLEAASGENQTSSCSLLSDFRLSNVLVVEGADI